MSQVRILQLREADQLRSDEVAVVVDVLRASTTIAVALDRGASLVHPVKTPAQARRVAAEHDEPVLIGERERGSLDGFVDNSPATLAGMDLDGRPAVLTTTNGTQALLAATRADRVLVGGLVNASALETALRGERVALLAAGWRGEPASDDDACCAYLAARFEGQRPDPAPTLAQLEQSTSAIELRKRGKHADVELCLRLDAAPVVPELSGGQITIEDA